MLFNKSVVLSINNWKVMVKVLVCQVIILALATALCLMFFGGLVEDIRGIFFAANWGEFLNETILSIAIGTFNGDVFAGGLRDCIVQTQQAIESLPNIWNRVEFSYLIMILLVVVYRMLISFTDVTVAFQIHEFMTSNTARPFTWFVVKKFGESLKFISLQMILTLFMDLAIVVGSITLCLTLTVSLRWWAIIPAGILALVLYTARITYFAFWLPALVTEDLSVSASLTRGASMIPYRFWQVFGKTFLIVLLMLDISVISIVYINIPILQLVVGTVPNLGLFFLIKNINMVEFFEATNRPYFYKKVDVEGTERFNKKMERKNRSKKRAK